MTDFLILIERDLLGFELLGLLLLIFLICIFSYVSKLKKYTKFIDYPQNISQSTAWIEIAFDKSKGSCTITICLHNNFIPHNMNLSIKRTYNDKIKGQAISTCKKYIYSFNIVKGPSGSGNRVLFLNQETSRIILELPENEFNTLLNNINNINNSIHITSTGNSLVKPK